MNRPRTLAGILCLGLAVSPVGGLAFGQECLLADFDEDGDPWTIRAGCPGDACTLNLILEVPPDPPLDQWFYIVIEEGCCDVDLQGHYGSFVEQNLDFTYVDSEEKHYPTCICCSAWILQGHFRPDAPLVPGERVVIATGSIHAVCSEPDPPCDPTHDFQATFQLETGTECEENTVYGGGLACSPASIDEGREGLGRAVTLHPIVPNPVADRLHYRIDSVDPGPLEIGVYDVSGRQVSHLGVQEIRSGSRQLSWDLVADDGARLADGVYFLRVSARDFRQTRMFVVAR